MYHNLRPRQRGVDAEEDEATRSAALLLEGLLRRQ